MAYTQIDLDAVKHAQLKLATGDRVVSVTVANHTTQYQQGEMDKLFALQRRIEEGLAAGTGTPTRNVVASFGKGL